MLLAPRYITDIFLQFLLFFDHRPESQKLHKKQICNEIDMDLKREYVTRAVCRAWNAVH